MHRGVTEARQVRAKLAQLRRVPFEDPDLPLRHRLDNGELAGKHVSAGSKRNAQPHICNAVTGCRSSHCYLRRQAPIQHKPELVFCSAFVHDIDLHDWQHLIRLW